MVEKGNQITYALINIIFLICENAGVVKDC